jgi:hypothetical protein
MPGWENVWLDRFLDVALSPALWLSVSLAAASSLLFYLWRGGGLRKLGLDLLAGLAGFAVGQAAGSLLRLPGLRLGDVQLFWGLLGAVVGLVFGRRLGGGRRVLKTEHAISRAGSPGRRGKR